MSTRCILDRDRLRLTADTPEEEQEILALFFSLAAEKLAALEAAHQSADAKAWKEAAHYLKGSAANLGMHAFAEACRNAESSAGADATTNARHLETIRYELTCVKEHAATL